MSKLSLNQSLLYTSGIAGSLLALKVYSDQVFKKDISGDKNKEPGDNNKNMVIKDSEKDTSGDTSKCGTSPEAKKTPLEDFMHNVKIVHSDIDSLKESSAEAILNAEKIIDYEIELKNDLASSQSQLDQAIAQSKKDSDAKSQAETELANLKDKLKLVEAKLNKTLSEFELFKLQSETHVKEKPQAEDKEAEIQSKLNQAISQGLIDLAAKTQAEDKLAEIQSKLEQAVAKVAEIQSQLDQAISQGQIDSAAKTQAETELADTEDKLKLVEAKLNKTLSEFELFKVQSETHVKEKTQAEDKVAEIQSKLNQAISQGQIDSAAKTQAEDKVAEILSKLNQAKAKMTKIQSQFDKTKDIIKKNSEVYTAINLFIQNNEIPVSDELKAKFKTFMSSFNFNIDEIVKE